MRESLPLWVPDFCRLSTLFAVIVGAEVVVVILSLAPLTPERWNPGAFGTASLFAQWIALVSATILCKLRVPLSLVKPFFGALLAVSVPIAVAAFGAWMLLKVDLGLGTYLGVPNADPARFVLRCASLAGLIGAAALRYAYVQDQWRQQIRAQAKAEVDALQARIRPHFLFNSMNTIASLVRIDPVRAERAVEDLSDLFRAALGAGEGESSLAGEVELAERFLAIESLRLGDRLEVRWQREEPLPWELKMPRLVLQPLVENAIIHGIARLAEGGAVDIRLHIEGKTLRMSVGNPCPRPESASVTPLETSNGHAQQSIVQRLRYRFGLEATMVTRYADGYYACELKLPL
jgi:two-component system, LytTR family, sensor histidine kinase AlgZ